MKARVFVLQGGRVQIFVDEGTPGEAKALTERILATLAANGVPLNQLGEVELHRTGVEHLHVQAEVQHDH
jgi:hypothetical protein